VFLELNFVFYFSIKNNIPLRKNFFVEEISAEFILASKNFFYKICQSQKLIPRFYPKLENFGNLGKVDVSSFVTYFGDGDVDYDEEILFGQLNFYLHFLADL